MAVFTPLNQNDILDTLSRYDVGALKGFEGILQGVDNTNFKIETTTGRYILTIFESRMNPDDLPYFLGLMAHLNQAGIVCPSPILPSPQPSPTRGEGVITIHKKPAALFSFLDGRDVKQTDITPALCFELGYFLAKMHIAGQSFSETRKNSMSFDAWESRFHKIGTVSHSYLETLHHVKSRWPQDLPRGNVHLDLFPDNVFIKDGKIYGAIDFYFSATDFLAYDVAIVMNAWCFDDVTFNNEKWDNLLNGYQSLRPLTEAEKNHYQTLCQGAAIRFLSSRLHDYLFHDPKNLVTPKSPDEYIQKLDFHKHAKLF